MSDLSTQSEEGDAPQHSQIPGALEPPTDERDSATATHAHGALKGGEMHSIHISPDGTVDMVPYEPHPDGGNVKVPPNLSPPPHSENL